MHLACVHRRESHLSTMASPSCLVFLAVLVCLISVICTSPAPVNKDKGKYDKVMQVKKDDKENKPTQKLRGPIVSTGNGDVEGATKQDAEGRTYDEFLGIPFAKPPIGDLRWAKPEAPESWEGVRNATQYGSHCEQIVGDFYFAIGLRGTPSEDCLYLNVFVPQGVDQAQNLPVMVYYYGGAYILGTAEMYPPPALAVHGDVIVVTFNYRVGVIGFMSTGDEHAVGNYALWDAKATLQWVSDNIRNFGGDPDHVTVFGQSAGGSMVSHSAISPQFTGLFQRVISMSGASSAFFGHTCTNYALDSAEVLAGLLFCPNTNTEAMVRCLRTVSAWSLDFWSYTATVVIKGTLPNWAPVVDGDIVTQVPRDAWAEGAANNVDFITGSTHHDFAGLLLLNPLGGPQNDSDFGFASSNETLYETLRLVLNIFGPEVREAGVAAMKERFPGIDDTDDLKRALLATELATDWVFGSAAHYEANQHSQTAAGRNTYQYHYQYRQSFLQYPSWVNGSHLDDVYSFLGEPFLEVYRRNTLGADFNDQDKAVKHNLMTYYTNFAHTGNPNQGPNVPVVVWPQYDSDNRAILHIGNNMVSDTESSDVLERYDYWNGPWRDVIGEADCTHGGPTSLDNIDVEKALEEHATKLEALYNPKVASEFRSLTQRALKYREERRKAANK